MTLAFICSCSRSCLAPPHPPPPTARLFDQLQKAYEELVDPQRRQAYDAKIRVELEKKKRLEQMDKKRKSMADGTVSCALSIPRAHSCSYHIDIHTRLVSHRHRLVSTHSTHPPTGFTDEIALEERERSAAAEKRQKWEQEQQKAREVRSTIRL